jgi:2-oxoacid:acceptor oxidoreductase delta subunit (pyruvate/2-ketoisovalerate family)
MSKTVCKPLFGEGGPPVERPAAERVQDLGEVVAGFGAEAAKRAAARCLGAHFCTFCEVCELLCPDQCITRHEVSGEILIDLDHCKGCGLCASFCPKGAIQMEQEQGG